MMSHDLHGLNPQRLENNFNRTLCELQGIHSSKAFIKYENNIKNKFKQVKLKVNLCLSTP
jgi:hypothetical protein